MKQGDLRTTFEERGYLSPMPLFGRHECRAILARLRSEQGRPPLDWTKGWAATSPDYLALATDERIVELVTELLGEDVLLWGASLVVRTPGRIHDWHTDIESSSPTGSTVSVWIGLVETNAGSSLKAVPYSHRFGMSLQQAMQEHGRDGAGPSDADVAAWARELDSRSGVVTVGSVDGEAVLFDGRLWHGSHNVNSRGTRCAVLFQYATPATPIRIPDLNVRWPFEFLRTPRPPCIVVSGHDTRAVNRVVPGPVAGAARLPELSSRIHTLELPLERDLDTGWKPQGLFRGATSGVSLIGAHVSVLEAGAEPHPPHRHEEEELLLVLDGETDLLVEDPADSEQTVTRRIARGSFVYYPANFAHTMHNISDAPVTYVIFKWATDRGGRDSLGHHLVALPELYSEMSREATGGRTGRDVLSGETKHLRQLGSHMTILQPGAGYEPHVDGYDVGIVLLEGTVETLGERVGRDSVIFYPAGEPHGMRNAGDAPAVYVVFEFKGSTSQAELLEDRRYSRRAWRAVRDPRRLTQAAGERARAAAARVRQRLPIA